jgi:hypothetical protein
MARPSFFLVCSFRIPDKKQKFFVPVPIWVLDDLLQTCFSLWNLVCRVRPDLPNRLDQHRPEIRTVLAEAPRLISVLRAVGPFTLGEVNHPEEDVEVLVRLI